MHSYTITPQYFIIRDCPESNLMTLFKDSHTLFRMRIKKLGRISTATTLEETVALRLMLEALIETKKELQNQESKA